MSGNGKMAKSDELLQSLFDDIEQTGPVNVGDILMDGSAGHSRKKTKKSRKQKKENEFRERKSKKKDKERTRECIGSTKIRDKKDKEHKVKKEKHKSSRSEKVLGDKDERQKEHHSSKGDPKKPREMKIREWDRGKITSMDDIYEPFKRDKSRSPTGHYNIRQFKRRRSIVKRSMSPFRNGRSPVFVSARRSRSPRRICGFHSNRSGIGFERGSRSRSRSWSPIFQRRRLSRSPKPRKLHEMKVDRKELIAIAEKNANKLMRAGKLPKSFNISASLKAKNIKELITYCEEISSKSLSLPINESLIEETDQDFDFTTLPVKAAIKLNVGVSIKPKSALERLIEENALRKAFPVSSGENCNDRVEWEPVPVETTVVSALSSKKVKVASVYLFSDPPPAAPVLSRPQKAKQELFLPLPPSAPVLDWNVLQPPPPPPVCAGFDAPAITQEIPAPPKVISDFAELLSEEERKLILGAPLASEPIPMEMEDGEIVPGSSRWEPISSSEFVEIKRKKDKKYKTDKKEAGRNEVNKSQVSKDGSDDIDLVVRRTIRKLVMRVEKGLSEGDLDVDELKMLADMLEDDTEEISELKKMDEPINAGSSDEESSSDRDDSEEGPLPICEKDNKRLVAIGESVFGSVLEMPNFSSDISMLPAVAPIRCGHLVAERARLSQHLIECPNDFTAKLALADVELKLSRWAESKERGSAKFGVAPLMDANNETRVPSNSIWATKDTLRNAPQLTTGIGAHLLQKMGWMPGMGLGRRMDGPIEPLILDVKSDRKGLFSEIDKKPPKREKVSDLNGKNPVSVIMEHCSKNGLPPPYFTQTEEGSQHCKRFGCTAVLNGIEYNAACASTNKKAAKAQVCLIMCRALGLGQD